MAQSVAKTNRLLVADEDVPGALQLICWMC